MAEFIVMPKLGFDMREGVLVGWNRDVGDTIEKGEVIAEIESDKATLELEAQAAGTLLKLLAGEGDVVPIGGNLAIVGEEGEDISNLLESGDGAAAATGEDSEAESETVAPSTTAEAQPTREEQSTQAKNGAFPGGVKATPVARRVAAEKGIDLSQVKGSGPGGRIRKADVEEFSATAPARPERALTPVDIGPESEEVETSRLRQAIGRRMVESKTTVPHFYVTTEIDMAPALALRKQINALLPDEQKVTVNDMIVKAAAIALRSYPNLNASFAGEKLVRHGRISVGSAVAVEGGLLTVVQKDTDRSSLAQIAADNKEMIARAREGKNRPSDFEAGTFTVSNLGAFDVDHFIAIINPPEAAILAVGTATQQPVVVDGELTIGLRMKATISADHRVTDGAEAARYMQEFKSILEQPLRLML
ncbi:MAG: dihydrolipoamide acetyltransferase family protein [Chloroflexota bacterium]|jgi:pyruvate dehydrogenase E2 component (dihydrolipoamide acetyltransferase)